MANLIWGVVAIVASLCALVIAFTPGTSRRLAALISPAPETAVAISPRTTPQVSHSALVRLEEELRESEQARVRLATRLDHMERQFDGLVTGSISGAAASLPPPAAAQTHTPSSALTGRVSDGPVGRTLFGVDLGPGGRSLTDISSQWSSMRSAHPLETEGLSPRALIRETDKGLEVRLIAGPFPNAEDASSACVTFQAQRIECRTSVFDGQKVPSR